MFIKYVSINYLLILIYYSLYIFERGCHSLAVLPGTFKTKTSLKLLAIAINTAPRMPQLKKTTICWLSKQNKNVMGVLIF